MNPRRCLRTKILFFTLTAVSILFVSDIVGGLTKLKLDNKEIARIESLNDIFEKNITVNLYYENPLMIDMMKNRTSGLARQVIESIKLGKKDKRFGHNKVTLIFNMDGKKFLENKNFIFDGIKHILGDSDSDLIIDTWFLDKDKIKVQPRTAVISIEE